MSLTFFYGVQVQCMIYIEKPFGFAGSGLGQMFQPAAGRQRIHTVLRQLLQGTFVNELFQWK